MNCLYVSTGAESVSLRYFDVCKTSTHIHFPIGKQCTRAKTVENRTEKDKYFSNCDLNRNANARIYDWK